MTVNNVKFPTGHFVVDLLRDKAYTNQAPSLLTVVNNQGKPLQQNAASVGFYGSLAPNVVRQYGI